MIPTSAPNLSELSRLRELARHSHTVITEHQDPGGAYPAAPTFSAYRGYAWLRDGSFTAEGISRYGDAASAGRFHDWVDGVLRRRRAQVDNLRAALARGETPSSDAMLPTRFTFDGENGSDPWWDFQTDGYGMWLWSVVTHAARHGLDLARWQAGIDVAVDYLVAFWDRPCYDWWEEHVEQRHVSTLGAIYGGLVAVAPHTATPVLEVAERIRTLVETEGVHDGHLAKWLGSSAVDGSLPSCVVPFGLVAPGSQLASSTLAAVAHQLDVDGGVHRFSADVFYGGGQWILLSALLGWNLAAAGDTAGAWRHLRWIADQADENGDLPEQVAHRLLHPDSRDEWVARWGTVASPLLWSHGMYLILADELGITDKDA
ncbi:glycoside hydrolase family 15 protein [Kribbella sp. CA-253562]|uniref:glycoside hydrolase family 15 protein n=1 Tax=Kribbella sp. CA-253562 TaxID=3239942 RepID=UPI003D92292C